MNHRTCNDIEWRRWKEREEGNFLARRRKKKIYARLFPSLSYLLHYLAWVTVPLMRSCHGRRRLTVDLMIGTVPARNMSPQDPYEGSRNDMSGPAVRGER